MRLMRMRGLAMTADDAKSGRAGVRAKRLLSCDEGRAQARG